jgi:hypothetical protein
MDSGYLVWSPSSSGFAIADSGGSGESNYFSYVDVSGKSPLRTIKLRRTGIRVFKRIFRCAGRNAYAHAWFQGWDRPGLVRLVVQDGVHSEGCSPPHADEIEIGVLGDPLTGRIDRVLRQADIEREWCTPEGRREFGAC